MSITSFGSAGARTTIYTGNPSTDIHVVDNAPLIFINCTDDLATVTTTGYLDASLAAGYPIVNDSWAFVSYNSGANQGFFEVQVTGSSTSLLLYSQFQLGEAVPAGTSSGSAGYPTGCNANDVLPIISGGSIIGYLPVFTSNS